MPTFDRIELGCALRAHPDRYRTRAYFQNLQLCPLGKLERGDRKSGTAKFCSDGLCLLELITFTLKGSFPIFMFIPRFLLPDSSPENIH